jgi:hypothetical protein
MRFSSLSKFRHALDRVERGFFGRHAIAHVLDDGVRSRHPQVLFAAAGRARAAHILIEPQAAADDGRIAYAPGDFPSQPAGGRNGRHLALLVQRDAIDGRVGGRRCDRSFALCPMNLAEIFFASKNATS